MSETTALFGNLLRRLRSAAALSQEALAERAGLSRHGVSDLERGARHAPRLETVRMLADALALEEADRGALLAAARPELLRGDGAPSAPSSAVSLPAPLTRLIGREMELTALRATLQDANVRLLTVTGPGGVGKTRLALALTTGMQEAFADGVVFVDLSLLSDPDLVVPTIAVAFGVQESADRVLLDRLVQFLAEKRLLLLLDNCEPVLTAAPDVAKLLGRCSGLTILATSREPWRVRGEQEFPLLPLPLPPIDRPVGVEEVQSSPAVALFVERAHAVQPHFALTAENADAVVAICQRLDGLPLAIELAAARIKLLPPAVLLARLEQRLPLLTGGGRDAPARQRTMRDAIAWSYDLLSAEEQALFRRLAVFIGGWSLEAAEAVGSASGDSTLGVLEGLASLADKSLLREDEGPDGEPRFFMLETVREYGVERLAASGEEVAGRAAHADYFLALTERTAPLLRGAEARARFAALEHEHGNFRAALAWFAANGEDNALLRLVAALGYFWTMSGHWTEGNAWLERALAADTQPSLARLEALENLGDSAGYQGNIARAEAALEEGLALARRLGEGVKVSSMLLTLGTVRVDQGQYEEGEAYLAEAMAVAVRAHDSYGEILAQAHLGIVCWGRGDSARAIERLETARTRAREVGHPLPAAVASRYLGLIATEAGDYARAAARHREWMDYDPDPVSAHILARTAHDVASLAAMLGEAEQAAWLFGAAAALGAAIGLAPAWPERGVHERARSHALGTLGDDAFDAAFNAGRRLSQEHILAEVEAVLDAGVGSPQATSGDR